MPSCFAPVLGEDVGGFVDADMGELGSPALAYGEREALPDSDGHVFRGGDGGREFRDFVIQMAMIVDREHFALDDIFEPFEVDDESADGVRLALNGDLE